MDSILVYLETMIQLRHIIHFSNNDNISLLDKNILAPRDEIIRTIS